MSKNDPCDSIVVQTKGGESCVLCDALDKPWTFSSQWMALRWIQGTFGVDTATRFKPRSGVFYYNSNERGTLASPARRFKILPAETAKHFKKVNL